MKHIVLVGFMGSGKSFLGAALANVLQVDFLDVDSLFEFKHKQSINDFFLSEGEQQFRLEEKTLLNELLMCPRSVIATGGGGFCSNHVVELINQNNLSIYLKVAEKQLFERLNSADAKHRPLIRNKSEGQLLQFIQKKLLEREPFYNKAIETINANELVKGDKPHLAHFYPVLQKYAPVGWWPKTDLQNLL